MDNPPKVIDAQHSHREDPGAHQPAASSCTSMQNPQVLNYSVFVAGSGCEVQKRTETSTLNGSGSDQP